MKTDEDTTSTPKTKAPFTYRSYFNYWLVLILPASILTIVLMQLLKGSFTLEFLKLPSTYLQMIIFQIVFGAWMYFRDFKPTSQKYKEGH